MQVGGFRRRMGLPPRVRSRPHMLGQGELRRGITSACAEQTRHRVWMDRAQRDYLRVCGADRMTVIRGSRRMGLPPRVRSRQLYFTVF